MNKKTFIEKISNYYDLNSRPNNINRLESIIEGIGIRDYNYESVYKTMIIDKGVGAYKMFPGWADIQDIMRMNEIKPKSLPLNNEKGCFRCRPCHGSGGFLKKDNKGNEYCELCEDCEGQGFSLKGNNELVEYMSVSRFLKAIEKFNFKR